METAATEAAYLRIQPKLDSLWSEKQPLSEADHDAAVETLRRVRARYIRTKETETLPKWQELADKEIERRRWTLAKRAADYDRFVQMIAEAAIESLGIGIDIREGRFGTEPGSPVVRNGLKAKANAAAAGEAIMTLFNRYAAQRLAEKRKRADTVNQDRKVVERFAAFVGNGRSVRSIQPADVRDWRDTIAALPPGYRASKAFAGLSIPEAAAKARQIGAKPVSPTTINKYLSTVSPFLTWCVINSYADRNPCDGLFYDVPKGANPRPPLTADQLAQIFRSPLFTGFLRDGAEHKPGIQTADDWRYWIPLVCLFTGARIGEIAQLRTEDVRSNEGIPYLLIRDDESTGQRTKSGHSRPAPIHSKLVAAGFLEFVERQRKRAAADENQQLFPQLRLNDRGQIGATPSRFWRDYLKRIGVKVGRDGIGAHSFRHTMADLLREADYLDDEIAVALGHNQKSVTGGYGRVKQGTVARISRMIEAVPFDWLAA